MAGQYASEVKLFKKWSFEDVECSDLCLLDFLNVSSNTAVYLPHTAGRYQKKRFRKAQCPIVERLATCLMFHGRNAGKKTFGCENHQTRL